MTARYMTNTDKDNRLKKEKKKKMFSVTIEQEEANRDLQKRYDLISYNQ